jgi:CHAT domain-containing protein
LAALALPALLALPARAQVSPDSIRVLYQRARAERAEPLVLDALAQPFARTRADSLRRAQWLDLLAEAQWRLVRRTAAADSIAELAVELRQRLHGELSEPVARDLATQARIWRYTRSPDSSAAGLGRAIALLQRVSPGARTVLADMLVSQGNTLREVGAFDAAVASLEHAVALRREALGAADRDVARGLINLGLAYSAAGQPQRRIIAEREACDIFEHTVPLDSLGLYITCRNLTGDLFGFREGFAAGPYVARCLELGPLLRAPGSQGIADDEENAGIYQLRTGDPRSARLHFDRALGMYRVPGAKLQPDSEARCWLNRSMLEAGDGRLDSALACVRRACDAFEALCLANPSPGSTAAYAAAVERMGQVLALAGRFPESERAFAHGAALYVTCLGSQHPDVAYALSQLAAMRLRMGASDSAAAPALRAAQLLTRHVQRELANMSEEEALSSRASGARPSLHMLLSLACRDPGAGRVNELWDACVRDEGSVLAAMGVRRDLLSVSGNAALREQSTALMRARAQLGHAELHARADSEQVKLRFEVRRLEQQLAASSARLAADFVREGAGAAEIAAALPPRSTLVHYLRFERSGWAEPAPARRNRHNALRRVSADGIVGPATPWYAAFVIRAGETRPRFVSLGPARAIEGPLRTWQALLARGTRSSPAERSAGQRLRQRVWGPIAAFTAGSEIVLLVPEGPLALLPFSTLPGRDGQPLLETAPTLHVLDDVQALVQPAPPVTEGRALFVGGADHGAWVGPGSLAASLSARVPGRSARCEDAGLPKFEALPGTVAELNAVARIWQAARGSAPEIALGAFASEATVRARATGCELVHLATHGFYLPDSCSTNPVEARLLFSDLRWAPLPPGPGEVLLRTGVVLAGANAPGPDLADDGILTSADLAMLDLSAARLVVLSACETAQGSVVEAEGVLGLRFALRQAGAHATLTSLHRVSDELTAHWMTLFYSRWLQDSLSVPAAARAASRSLRRELLARGEGDRPGVWGAFLTSGDWH